MINISSNIFKGKNNFIPVFSIYTLFSLLFSPLDSIVIQIENTEIAGVVGIHRRSSSLFIDFLGFCCSNLLSVTQCALFIYLFLLDR